MHIIVVGKKDTHVLLERCMVMICHGRQDICSKIMERYGDWSVLISVTETDMVIDSPYFRLEFKHNGDIDVINKLLAMAKLMYQAVGFIADTVSRCVSSGEALHST